VVVGREQRIESIPQLQGDISYGNHKKFARL
jgi:hypothetical protein